MGGDFRGCGPSMGCGRHQSVFPLVVVSQLNKQFLNGGHFLKSHLNIWGLCCVTWEVVARGAVSVK